MQHNIQWVHSVRVLEELPVQFLYCYLNCLFRSFERVAVSMWFFFGCLNVRKLAILTTFRKYALPSSSGSKRVVVEFLRKYEYNIVFWIGCGELVTSLQNMAPPFRGLYERHLHNFPGPLPLTTQASHHFPLFSPPPILLKAHEVICRHELN
jgi:hypothetical protein